MKYDHLTSDDRNEIQDCLYKGTTFKHIAKRVGKSPTCISKEVKKHIQVKEETKGLSVCPRLLKPPFVCNPCKQNRHKCGFQKQFYYAKMAQQRYEFLLTDCRTGIALNKQEFYDMDKILTEGLRKGQRLYHIKQTANLPQSTPSIYRYLNKGYLSGSKTSFPRVVSFKPRKGKRPEYIPKKMKIGRTFADFEAFKEAHDVKSWVEMDTLIGRPGGKTIMTMLFTDCNFMFGLLLENKTSAEVTEKINILKTRLNENSFNFEDIFPVILTDNGSEFANIFAIETQEGSSCKLFFCDPYQSSQKPRVEKNHEEFRNIVPSGKSFDDFTQETINLIFSHINSTKRRVLHGKTPYELFTFLRCKQLAGVLGISEVPASEVIQSPSLLKKSDQI